MPADQPPARAAVTGLPPAPAPLRDNLGFLRGFLRHQAQVGSVWPSSRRLEQRLVTQSAAAFGRLVVQLGPGTGGTTAALLHALPATGRLLPVELERLPAARRLPAPDAIVSGIPFSTLPPHVADRITAMVARCLAPGGHVVAYQVRAHVERYARPDLGPAQRGWEWINVPPVRVFRWTRPGG